MVIKTQVWEPDTCGCVLKVEYDNAASPVVYTLKEMVKTCAAHTVLATNTEKKNTVFDENRLKNQTMKALRDNVPELQTTDEEGNIVLKANEVSFKFEGTAPNRRIRITTKVDISAYEQAIRDDVGSQAVEVGES